MNKLTAISVAVAFAMVAIAGPASAIGLLDTKDDTLATPDDQEYIGGFAGRLNFACGVEGEDVGNIGGVCVDVEEGDEFTVAIADDLFPAEIGGGWRIIDESGNIGDTTAFCTTIDVEVPTTGQFQVFVGSDGTTCPSVGTTGTVEFS